MGREDKLRTAPEPCSSLSHPGTRERVVLFTAMNVFSLSRARWTETQTVFLRLDMPKMRERERERKEVVTSRGDGKRYPGIITFPIKTPEKKS